MDDLQPNVVLGADAVQPVDANRSNSMKLPPFWREDIELWFAQMEFAFDAARITSTKTKFQYAMAELDHSALQAVRDLVVNPGQTPYETLRERLVAEYSASATEKVRQLLQTARLGDQKPSQFLRYLKNLAGGVATDELIKTLWLRALPLRTQEILAVVASAELDDLAKLADQTLEVTLSPTNPFHTPLMSVWSKNATPISTQPPAILPVAPVSTPSIEDTLTLILEELRAVRKQLNALSVSDARRQRRSPARNRTGSREKSTICLPHRRYGDAAYSCKPPCTYKSKNADA
jgi:hypothetical protein